MLRRTPGGSLLAAFGIEMSLTYRRPRASHMSAYWHLHVYLDFLVQLSPAWHVPAALQLLSEPHKFRPPHNLPFESLRKWRP